MSEMFSRRSFLKLSGALVAASALAACSGGGGGGNGGSGGGGDVPYNPSAYYDIDGLKMGTPSIGGLSGKNFFSLTLHFINEGPNEIILSKNDFTNMQLGTNLLTLKGFDNTYNDSCSIPHTSDSNHPTVVTVYFESTSAISYGNLSFELTHGSKKAVCSGAYPIATWTITVQDSN